MMSESLQREIALNRRIDELQAELDETRAKRSMLNIAFRRDGARDHTVIVLCSGEKKGVLIATDEAVLNHLKALWFDGAAVNQDRATAEARADSPETLAMIRRHNAIVESEEVPES